MINGNACQLLCPAGDMKELRFGFSFGYGVEWGVSGGDAVSCM